MPHPHPKDFIFQQAEKNPDKVALVYRQKELTYQELSDIVETARQFLQDHSVGHGDVVFMAMGNTPTCLAVFYALLSLDAVAFIIPPKITNDELSGLLVNLPPPFLVVDELSADSQWPLARVWQAKIEDKKFVASALNNSQAKSFDSPLKAGGALLLSSGSTGRPKLVYHSAERLYHLAKNVAEGFGLTSKERAIGVVPVQHIIGLGAFLVFMRLGATLILENEIVPQAVLADIKKHQATWLIGSPFLLTILAKSFDSSQGAVASLVRCVSSGGELDQKTYELVRQKMSIPVHELYGSTETAIVTARIDDGVYRQGFVGKPVDGMRVAIFDDQGNTVPTGMVGNIAVFGPTVIDAYVGNSPANQKSFINGWFLMGDRGFLDEAGGLYYVGRTNMVINVGGNKVDIAEVERVLNSCPGVAESAVYGLRQRPTEVVAAAVVGGDEKLTAEKLRNYCTEKLLAYKIPKEIVFVQVLPRTKTGKIDRQALVKDS